MTFPGFQKTFYSFFKDLSGLKFKVMTVPSNWR